MKKLIIAALAVFAAGAAMADDPTIDNAATAQSQKTRTQVLAEMARAKADGSIKVWSNRPQIVNPVSPGPQVARTRAEVKADVVAARQQGELNSVFGEDSGSLSTERLAQRKAPVAPGTLATAAR